MDPTLDSNLKDPQTSADVFPTAVTKGHKYELVKNIVLRSDKPTDAYVQSGSLGLIPKGTQLTALSTSIAYDRPGDKAVLAQR